MATPATFNIDLKKQSEVADLVAGLEVGATVILETSIQAKDDQTLTLKLVTATTADGEEAGEEAAKPSEKTGIGNPTDNMENDSSMGMGMDKPVKGGKGLPADL